MPTLLRTFDISKMYAFCMNLWPFTFIALPLLNFLARSGTDATTGLIDSQTQVQLWIGIALVLGISRVASLAFS